MKVYRTEVTIHATAYIVASSPEEAQRLADENLTDMPQELLEETAGGFVRGCQFETLIEEIEEDDWLPRVTLSPAITIAKHEEVEEAE